MRRPGSRTALIAVLLLAVVIFGAVYYAWNTVTDIFQPVDSASTSKNVPFEITPGETTAQIADNLEQKKLIHNALAFRVWARIKGLDTHLQAGIYKKINSSMTISDIIDQLLNAQPDAVRVIIPEGFRIEQIAQRFANAGLTNFKKDDFIRFTKHIDQFPDAGKYPILQSVPAGQGMEGLLFPAAYEVPVDANAAYVVNQMLKTMNEAIQEHQLAQMAQQNQMSLYQMLTLASIVEREARFPEDRPNIASVYWNRVYKQDAENAGFMQADPTVQYARDSMTPPDTASEYWKPLPNDRAPSFVVPDSPWNTYTKKGLPPSPICSPGLASLEAAAAPPKTDFLYFFAKKDGHSIFARTNAEFEELKQKYPVSG